MKGYNEKYAIIRITDVNNIHGILYKFDIVEHGGYELIHNENRGWFYYGSGHWQHSTKINSIEEWKAQTL